MSKSHIQKNEKGSKYSYIIGFLMSLILTTVPYYLVTTETIQGSALLTTILGFAMLQMMVQIFFFLHLGRGPKPLYNLTFFIHTFSIILVVVLGSVFIMNSLHYNMDPNDVTKMLAQDEAISEVSGLYTGACKQIGTRHKVTIAGGKVSPSQIEAKLCDTLTFINEDNETREMAFGKHPAHDGYAGEEVLVRKGRPKTITLNGAGKFIFHDHLDPAVTGNLTVNP